MSDTLIDYYPEDNYSTAYNFTVAGRRVGQAFTMPDQDYYITSAKFWLKYTTATNFTMSAELYNTDGGSPPKPSGSAIEVSDTVNGSVLSTSYQWVEFNFSGDTLFEANSVMAVVVRCHTYTSGTMNVGIDGGGGTHPGNCCYSSTGSSWGTYGEDCMFYIYGLEPATAGSVKDTSDLAVILTNLGVIKTIP